jgi:hypothetical protein
MPHVTKLYNRLHLLRLRSAVDDYVLAEQAGFRPGRSTREQFMAHKLRRAIQLGVHCVGLALQTDGLATVKRHVEVAVALPLNVLALQLRDVT